MSVYLQVTQQGLEGSRVLYVGRARAQVHGGGQIQNQLEDSAAGQAALGLQQERQQLWVEGERTDSRAKSDYRGNKTLS